MRLWSLHPEYLDAKGLVALWREGLLAQKVLLGKTTGYRNHPQLARFKDSIDPLGAIAGYLRAVVVEADRRGYRFNGDKIIENHVKTRLPVNSGQVEYEFQHLLAKLEKRDPESWLRLKGLQRIKTHPLFCKKKGGVEKWEVVA